MTNARKDQPRRSTGKKQAYRTPKLTVHGDLRALTKTKTGTKSDGTGKPATRASGSNA